MLKPSRKPDAHNLRAGRKTVRFRKRRPVTIIDFDGDHLRVVQASPQGVSARITRLASPKFEAPKGKPDPQSFGLALKKALEECKIKPKEIVIAVPRGQVVLRPLQVPMVADVRELSSVINFQIAKDLPFRLEEAVVDFKVLRQLESAPREAEPAGAPAEADAPAPAPQPRLEVFVGAIKSEIVQFHQAVARAAGLKLAGLALRSTGIARVVAEHYPAPADGSVAVVSVRQDEITIEIIEQNGLVFSRVAAVPALGVGAGELSEPGRPEFSEASFLKQLGVEVVRSLHSYEGMMGHKPVKKMLTVGGTGFEPEITRMLAGRVSFPVEELDPLDCLKAKDSDREDATRCFAAIGVAYAALQPAGLPLDFANPKRPPVQRNTKRIKMLSAAVAVVAVLFTLLGVRANLINKRQAIRTEAQLQLSSAEKKQKVYRTLILQGRVVNSWVSQNQNWLDHLAYLSAILPGADQIYVSALTTTPQHIIRMSVQAKSGEVLSELDKKLRAAGYQVKPLSITPANDRHGYNFRTTVELGIPSSMKPDLKELKPPARPADDTHPQAVHLQTSSLSLNS